MVALKVQTARHIPQTAAVEMEAVLIEVGGRIRHNRPMLGGRNDQVLPWREVIVAQSIGGINHVNSDAMFLSKGVEGVTITNHHHFTR